VTQRLPYGSWPSPITPEKVVLGSVSLGELKVVDGDLMWSELRPAEGGRVQLVRLSVTGTATDLLPEGVSARTRVHEYGGGAWTADGDSVWFSRWDGQRLWRFDDDGSIGPLTPEPEVPAGLRYADADVPLLWGSTFVCVRERHPEDGSGAVNEVVAVPHAHDPWPGTEVVETTALHKGEPSPLERLAETVSRLPPWSGPPAQEGRGIGDDEAPGGEPVVLVSGPDFVASPRCSPDGGRLAWLQWDHPDMPWDAAELWVGELVDGAEGDLTLVDPRRLLGGAGVSVVEPQWTEDGRLLAVTDASEWWNLVEVPIDGSPVRPLHQDEVEVGLPLWVFGQRRYAQLPDGRIACAFASNGLDHLGIVADGHLTELDTPFTNIAQVVAYREGVALVAATPTDEATVVYLPLPAEGGVGEVEVVRPRRDIGIDPAWFSSPRPIQFPSQGGRTAHALFYPPAGKVLEGLEGEKPPAIVMIHGGPTSSARAMLSLATQFWTSRGFAVVDVNYGGSTGYGRPYRELLKPTWGIVDVQDCAAAVRWLAEQGEVDGERLAIRGGSAGGFTTLAALIFTDVFSVGASLYGVTDLAALATDTHKFESRYLDGLVGRWPEDEAVYAERSPIHHLDQLDRPLIVFQGLEDEVVPPSQAEALVAALAERGIEHEHHAFQGEQHGFRKAETVIEVLQSELAFYQRVLHLT